MSRNVLRSESELKCYSFNGTGATSWTPNLGVGSDVNATWSFQSCLAGLVQGTNAFSRVGNKIWIKNIELCIDLFNNAATAAAVDGSTCRFVLFRFKDPRGALPNMTGTGPQIFDVNSLISGRNVTNLGSFAMKFDINHQMVILDQAGATPSSGPRLTKIFKIPIESNVNFGGNAGTISDLNETDFVAGVCADGAACCRLGTFYIKVWFKDL